MSRTLRPWILVCAGTGTLLGVLGMQHPPAAGGDSKEELLWTVVGGIALLLAAVVGSLLRKPLSRLLEPSGAEDASLRAGHPFVTLFLASFVCLFLEVMLIRYAGSQVRIFSFYKNIPLISCYLGMGIGCFLRGARSRHVVGFLLWLIPVAVGLSVGTLAASHYLAQWAAAGSSEQILGDIVKASVEGRIAAASQVLMGAFAVATMIAVTLLFVPLGRLLGDAFQNVPRLTAYSLNIFGSLIGVFAFVLMSYLWTPPWVWFLVGLVPLVWWLSTGTQRATAVVLIGLNVLAVLPSVGTTVWSPYQKLVGREQTLGGTGLLGYEVNISDVFYQLALDLRPEALAKLGMNPYPHYDGEFAGLRPGGKVVIVGAGTGNDVAAALRAGAGQVDAVDIDPAIVQMGRQHHPEHPYDDPRVRQIVDDARSVFHKLPAGSYDAVVFGLLDSHTQLGVSSVRLDNYVFTRESFADAKRLLLPEGRLIVTAATFRDWFRKRLTALLAATCSTPVDVRQYKAWVTYSCTPSAGPSAEVEKVLQSETLPTDDWPFLYLPNAQVPAAYLVVIGMLALTAVLILRSKGVPLGQLEAAHWHLFFMGAAFLLVEVHAINRLALLFGTTWLVSAITIALVLVLILLANLTAMVWPSLPYGVAYAGLFGGLLLSYGLKGASVAGLGPAVTFAYALIQVLPVYFAGLIFARSFVGANTAGAALGANMLGAVLGGWVEYASMAIGIRALVLLAIALYVGSLLALLRDRRRLFSLTPIPPP